MRRPPLTVVTLVIAAAALVVARAVAGTAIPAVIARIPVGAGPYSLAVDPASHEVFVADGAANTVSVISERSDEVVATIPVGVGPQGVAVDSLTHRAYVSDYGQGGTGDTVSVIDEKTNSVIHTITVGLGPHAVAVDAITDEIYVADAGGDGGSFATGGVGNTVSVINGRTDVVTKTFTVGPGPWNLALDPGSRVLYVADADIGRGGNVAVVSLPSDKVTRYLTAGSGPSGVAVDEVADRLYVANAGVGCPGGPDCGDTVTVFSTRGGSKIATLGVGAAPEQVAIDATRGLAYVTNGTDSSLSVINVASDRVLGTVPAVPNPVGVSVDSVTHAVYVANSAQATVSVLATQIHSPPLRAQDPLSTPAPSRPRRWPAASATPTRQ